VWEIPLDRSSANSVFVAGHALPLLGWRRKAGDRNPIKKPQPRNELRLFTCRRRLLLLFLLSGLLVALLLSAVSWLLFLLLTRLLIFLAALALLATLVWIAHVFPRLVSVYASSQSLAERAGSIWEELSTPIRSVRPSWNTDCKGRRVGYPGSPPQKWMTA
jgi:small-conductance mechanosensitive channel